MKNILLQNNHRYKVFNPMKKVSSKSLDYVLINESSNQQTNLFTLVPGDLYTEEPFAPVFTMMQAGILEKDTPPISLENMDDCINLSSAKLFTVNKVISEWNKIRQIEMCNYPSSLSDSTFEPLQYFVKGKPIWDYTSTESLSDAFLENFESVFNCGFYPLINKFARIRNNDKKYIVFSHAIDNMWEFTDSIPLVFDHIGIRVENTIEYYIFTYEQFCSLANVEYLQCCLEYFKMEKGITDYEKSVDSDTIVMNTIDSYLKFVYNLPIFYLYNFAIGKKFQKDMTIEIDYSHKDSLSTMGYRFSPSKDETISTYQLLELLISYYSLME